MWLYNHAFASLHTQIVVTELKLKAPTLVMETAHSLIRKFACAVQDKMRHLTTIMENKLQSH